MSGLAPRRVHDSRVSQCARAGGKHSHTTASTRRARCATLIHPPARPHGRQRGHKWQHARHALHIACAVAQPQAQSSGIELHKEVLVRSTQNTDRGLSATVRLSCSLSAVRLAGGRRFARLRRHARAWFAQAVHRALTALACTDARTSSCTSTMLAAKTIAALSACRRNSRTPLQLQRLHWRLRAPRLGQRGGAASMHCLQSTLRAPGSSCTRQRLSQAIWEAPGQGHQRVSGRAWCALVPAMLHFSHAFLEVLQRAAGAVFVHYCDHIILQLRPC